MTKRDKEVGIRLSVKDKEVAVRALQQFGKEGTAALEAIEKSGRPASDGLKLVNEGARAAQDGLRGVAGEAGGLGRLLSRGGLIGLGIAGLVGGLTMLSNKVVAVSRELREIEEEARRSGLGVEAFQEMTFAAQQLNISQDAVKDGFRELNIRASEFAATGGGSAAEAFKQIGLSQAQVRAGLADTEKLFADIVDRLGEFGRSDQIRMSDQIFGGQGGEQFMAFIEAGASSIARLREEARALGVVLDKDLFVRAREVESRFGTVARVIDTQLKTAFMELAPIVLEAGNFIVWVADIIRDIADAIAFMRGEMDKLSTRNLEMRLTQIGAERVELEGEKDFLQGDDWRPQSDPLGMASEIASQAQNSRLAQIEAGLNAISEEERRILDILAGRDAPSSSPPPPREVVDTVGVDELARKAQQLMDRLRSASDQYAATMAELNAMLARGLIDQESYNRAVAEAVLKRAEAVDTEADYAEALRLVDAARSAGILSEIEYTETVQAMIRQRLEAQNDWTAGFRLGMLNVVEQNKELAAQVGDAWTSAFGSAEDALVDLVTTGKADIKSLADSIIADLLRIAIRQGITGPVANFLSSFVGGVGGVSGKSGATVLSPVAHDGWLVARGNPPGMRAMNAGLDRFHQGGLNRRERLIVAQEGEGIFTPRQMDNADGLLRTMMASLATMAGREAQPAATRVEIHNYGAEKVTHQSGRGGDGVNVEKIIIGTVAAGMGRGDFDSSMRAVWGLKRGGK